jgi:hypothetical protein
MKLHYCSPVRRPGHLAWGQGTADRIQPIPGAWGQGTAELFKIVHFTETGNNNGGGRSNETGVKQMIRI